MVSYANRQAQRHLQRPLRPDPAAILARLASGAATVKQLAEPFDMTLPAISKHLKVLERGGLISRGREAQWRPCSIDSGALKDIAAWMAQYRRFWDESFDRLGEYLSELQKGDGSGPRN